MKKIFLIVTIFLASYSVSNAYIFVVPGAATADEILPGHYKVTCSGNNGVCLGVRQSGNELWVDVGPPRWIFCKN